MAPSQMSSTVIQLSEDIENTGFGRCLFIGWNMAAGRRNARDQSVCGEAKAIQLRFNVSILAFWSIIFNHAASVVILGVLSKEIRFVGSKSSHQQLPWCTPSKNDQTCEMRSWILLRSNTWPVEETHMTGCDSENAHVLFNNMLP